MLILRHIAVSHTAPHQSIEESKLLQFLMEGNANLSPRVCLNTGRSGESHWTTDNDNIVQQGRIGSGGLGDVYRVALPNIFLMIDV